MMGQRHPCRPNPPLTRTMLGQLWVSRSRPTVTEPGLQPRISSGPASTTMQCLRPLRQSGGHGCNFQWHFCLFPQLADFNTTWSECVCVCVCTSMRDDSLVRLNTLHVDAVLLLPDDDCPPQFGVLSLLLCTVFWDSLARLPVCFLIGPLGVTCW